MTLRIRTTIAGLALWPLASIAFAQAPQAAPTAPTAEDLVPVSPRSASGYTPPAGTSPPAPKYHLSSTPGSHSSR